MKKITFLLILSISTSFCQTAYSDLHGGNMVHLTEANANFSSSPSQYTGKTPEFVISANCIGGNVVAFQNTSPTDVSAITFRNEANVEKGAIGIGNSNSVFLSKKEYIEVSDKTGSPDDFAIINTTARHSEFVFNISGVSGTTMFTPLAGPNLAAKFQTDGQLQGTVAVQDLDEASAPGFLILDQDGQKKMVVGYANTGFSDLNLAGKGFVQFPGDFVFRNTGTGHDYPLIVNGDGIVIPSVPPDSSTSAGQTGQIAWDAKYLYVCTGKDKWKRSPLFDWDGPVYTELDRTTLAHHRLTLMLLVLTTGACIVSSVVSAACLLKLSVINKRQNSL